jgi:hypothetical protein
MLMLRCYLNFFEAGMVKSFLDDHDIFCALFDENVHVYTGAFPAIPIRLVVSDVQFKQAAGILRAAERSIVEGGGITASPQYQAALDQLDSETVFEEDEEIEQPPKSNNPWEILSIAYLFLVPGLGFVLEQRPLTLVAGRKSIMLSPFQVHFVGAFLITATLLITLCYFYVRQAIAREIQK